MLRQSCRGGASATLAERLPILERWFATERGRLLLSRQKQVLDDVLAQLFGYHLLQISVGSSLPLASDCRVQNKYSCYPLANDCSALCDFEQLPFASESLDVVILHHVQEHVSDPYQLLREIQRVVIPDGHVLILGFNPWSPLGLYSRFAGLKRDPVWEKQLISAHKMIDRLKLLGFSCQQYSYGYHMPQALERINNPSVKRFLEHMPSGNFYLIHAIRRVESMTPVKMKWQSKNNGFRSLSPVKSRITSRKFK